MATQTKSRENVSFGEYELDCRTGDLRRNGVALKLQPQPAKVLAILVRRSGEVVARQELAEQVWGSETYVDFEHGLNFAIRQIRSVLKDDAEQPRFLETVPKRGYRFIAAVREGPVPNQTPPTTATVRSSRRLYLVASVLVVGIAAIATLSLSKRWFAARGSHGIQSLAVLPLHNLSADPEQEYFSDGMTDELITDVAKVSGLRVISHTSVERYKGTKRQLPEIARELGVDAIIEGTILRSGDRVRITAQLIDGHSDHHLWADSYERDVTDVLALQNDVARAIASEVAIKLGPAQQERLWTTRRIVPQAHEAYLKGLYDASKLTPQGLQTGIEYFDEAIQLDAGYAPAYAGKAEAYGWAAGLSISPPGEVLPKARSAANKAIELDETLSQAHHALGWVIYALDWDAAAAEAQFKRAVELNANDVTAHLWYGMFLAQRGRIGESVAEMKRAQELDPLSLMVNALAATPLLESRQYDAAISQAQKALIMDPSNGVGHWVVMTAYEGKGELPKAIDEMEQMAILWGQSAQNAAKQVAPLRDAYAKHGAKGYWQNRLESLNADSVHGAADPYRLAVILARLGENDRAFASLEKSYAIRSTELLYWLQGEPAFDSLHDDPRFQNLLRRIGVQSAPRA